MAAPQTKRHATLVSDFEAAAQGASTQPLDFSEGSVFLALAEATAGLGTWLQKLYLFALSVTRLVSSKGVWVDTFVNAFGMTRNGAIASTGPCVFSRISVTSQVVVPIGGVVGTGDGTRTFTVYADPGNGAFSAAAGGYLILAGANTVTVPVQASTAGKAGNVSANTISKIKSPMSGVDAVTNLVAFTNGQDPERDAAVKIRFVQYIASLARATRAALAYAVSALGLGLQTAFAEFTQPNGARSSAMSTIYIDDGSGAPPASSVQAAANAIYAYKAFGVRIAVVGATRLIAHVEMTIEVAAGYAQPLVVAAVEAALAVYINGLGLGQPLRFTMLEHIAYGQAGVINVTAVSLNGGTADLAPTQGQTIKAGNINATPAA